MTVNRVPFNEGHTQRRSQNASKDVHAMKTLAVFTLRLETAESSLFAELT